MQLHGRVQPNDANWLRTSNAEAVTLHLQQRVANLA